MRVNSNVAIVVAVALFVAALIVVWKPDPKAHPASIDPGQPPAPSVQAQASVTWVNGYAIGPASAIAKLGAESDRGSHTGCATPPPNADAKKSWVPGTSPLATVRLIDLAAKSDRDLTAEIDQRLMDKIYGPGFAVMSGPEKSAYLVETLEFEVANGGLDQYFTNSSGNCALQTLRALREMGFVSETASFEKAIAVFPDAHPAEDRATRFDQVEALGPTRSVWRAADVLTALTGSAIYAAYLRKNLVAFDLPPN